MFDISFADKISRAYTRSCKALCHELDIPQTAFDILMFLANHPEYKSARDIVEIRRIKANLVSINVDRLVQEQSLMTGAAASPYGVPRPVMKTSRPMPEAS